MPSPQPPWSPVSGPGACCFSLPGSRRGGCGPFPGAALREAPCRPWRRGAALRGLHAGPVRALTHQRSDLAAAAPQPHGHARHDQAWVGGRAPQPQPGLAAVSWCSRMASGCGCGLARTCCGAASLLEPGPWATSPAPCSSPAGATGQEGSPVPAAVTGAGGHPHVVGTGTGWGRSSARTLPPVSPWLVGPRWPGSQGGRGALALAVALPLDLHP